MKSSHSVCSGAQSKCKISKPFFGGSRIQAKMKDSQAHDPMEVEAEAVSENIMNQHTTAPFFSGKPGSTPSAKHSNSLGDNHLNLRSVNQTLTSTGDQLDQSTKLFMEQKFGRDFADVKIHNDSKAHQSANEIDALAYTHGDHIVFGRGQYHHGSTKGKQLLAHELTHVVQQQSGGTTLQKQKAHVNIQQQEAQLKSDFQALRTAVDTVSLTDVATKNVIRQKVKKFFQDFANYHPTPGYQSESPAADLFQYEYINVYSLTEVTELAGRLQFIGLTDEAKLFRGRGITPSSHRSPRQVDDEFYASYTDAALQRIDTTSVGTQSASLSELISAFKYLSGEIATMDPSKIGGPAYGSGSPDVAIKSGYWTEWDYYQGMRSRLGAIYAGMQRIIQSQMDKVTQELDSTGEAPSIPVVQNTLDLIGKQIPESVAFTKPVVNLKSFDPRQAPVEITKSEFTDKGNFHKDFFNDKDTKATVKIKFYDKTQTQGNEKNLPIFMMHQIRREQLKFIKNFYGLTDQGKKVAGKEHPSDLMGAGKLFRLFSIADWREFLDKKFDDLTKNKKLSNANALMELIQLIKSYMKAFTIHTPYDIDDFGDNYLSQTFPRALTGQLIHDCGVYALKTAFFVSLIAPKIGLKFQYIFLPNHVGLIMTGKDLPVFIMHNDDFTIIPMTEKQFDDLNAQNQSMILGDRSMKAYLEAKAGKQSGPVFTVDKLKDAWIKDTKTQRLKGAVTDEQFIAEQAANLFVPKVDMPFSVQNFDPKDFDPRLSIDDTKKKMFDEYKRMNKASVLFNPKTPDQFNLRYLSLTVQIKDFNNKVLLPYWNGKALAKWKALVAKLKSLETEGNKAAYIAELIAYRKEFENDSNEVFKRYDPMAAEKLSIHADIESKTPDPLSRGTQVSLGSRGLTENWQIAFNSHLVRLDARIQGLTNNTETFKNGTDITPAFAVETMQYYP